MSEHPNVTTVNRMTQAIVDRDSETSASLFTDDFVLHLRGPFATAGDHLGVAGILGAIGAVFEATNGDVKLEQQFCVGVDGWAAEWEHAVLGRTARRSSRTMRSCTGSPVTASPRCGCSWGPTPTPPPHSSVSACGSAHTGGVGLDKGRRDGIHTPRAWGEEYRQLLGALDAEQGLDVEELDQLATAAYMTGRDDESFELWGRGHQRCLETGDVARAARFGVRLAQAQAFKGDIARASGWVERSHLLDEANLDCVERGFLEHAAGMCRIFADGDIAAARAAFGRAAKIGERFRDRELLTFARIAEGRCLIYLGEIAEGLRCRRGHGGGRGPRDPADGGRRRVLHGHRRLPRVVRPSPLRAVDGSFTRWCEAQSGLVLYRGHCLLHRAEL